MKKFLTALLIITAVSAAPAQIQPADKLPADTVVIADLVQKQIAEARMRDSLKAAAPAVSQKAEIIYAPPVKAELKKEESKNYFSFLNGISTEVIILVLFSFAMFLWIAYRRTIFYLKNRDKVQLKRNIMMLREERVPQKFGKRKRKILKIASPAGSLNDTVLARKARELNITQGELLLASRIKNFETGKR